jgi:hypothetical protein
VQIKANSDALGTGLLDAKKSEPLSLEEILKKRKEDALQQAKVYAPLISSSVCDPSIVFC